MLAIKKFNKRHNTILSSLEPDLIISYVLRSGKQFHNVFCWTSWLPEFFTPQKMTSSSKNDCWALKRDIILCNKHNPQYIFLENCGRIIFSQKLPQIRSMILHHYLISNYASCFVNSLNSLNKTKNLCNHFDSSPRLQKWNGVVQLWSLITL